MNNNGYSIVYLRPDGWWEAGNGWDTVDEAREDGRLHEWRHTKWAIVPTEIVEEIDGDRRMPIMWEPDEIEEPV